MDLHLIHYRGNYHDSMRLQMAASREDLFLPRQHRNLRHGREN